MLSRLASEDDELDDLKLESLGGLVKFFRLHGEKMPSVPCLVLSNEGHLRAIWGKWDGKKKEGLRVGVRFIDTAKVSYVVLNDDFEPLGGKSSIEGFMGVVNFDDETVAERLS